ncbi:MAG: DNA translocase FtsK 4TM domain-containing protein [Candidatus Krumholzibacteriota bacterium]|nr:DNA translocase FtsK 4TM domain-containing protein [Candidatus Krumholzibacteriota bacterium]
MAVKRKITTGLLLVTAAVFTGVALYSYDFRDWGAFLGAQNLCGPLGAVLAGVLRWAAGGIVSWAVPLFLLYWGWVQISGRDLKDSARPLICAGILAVLFPALLSSLSGAETGGFIGEKVYGFFELISGRIGSLIILFAANIMTFLILIFGSVKTLIERISGLGLFHFWSRSGVKNKKEKVRKAARKKKGIIPSKAGRGKKDEEYQEEMEPEFVEIDIPTPKKRKPVPRPKPAAGVPEDAAAGSTPADNAPLPDLSLLDDYDDSSISYSKEDLIARSEVIEAKLEDFGLKGKIQKVLPGPVVTTFEFVPAPGVKVSQIANRADDISLALAARALRIQAPIPGKGAVGIEVPNPEPKLVLLKELMEHFPPAEEGLMVCVGKSVTGEPVFVDIAEMPHLLIAGATGSGKSVCINTLICSLLFNHTPATCRFVLIDPKRLELITYDNIPHLLHPVITEAKQSLKVLNFLTIEMDRRYKLLAQFGVKNIKGFNKKVISEKLCDRTNGEPLTVLPYYVCIIDELADIMVTLGNEIYPPITRLAQMARAVGIHLVFATQRPSVDVITGLIKANFPSRMAFQVTSKTDSRTILDVNGAETLLGNGDMLYLPKNLPAPVRIQGAYISERETENVAEYWRSFQGGGAIDLTPDTGPELDGSADIDDDLYEKAKELVIMHQQGSISLVQRRLRVGYARAARLIDMLEQSGVVGPFEGSKAREVLISREEYEGI